MRKRIVGEPRGNATRVDEGWMNVEDLAAVEVTSEAPGSARRVCREGCCNAYLPACGLTWKPASSPTGQTYVFLRRCKGRAFATSAVLKRRPRVSLSDGRARSEPPGVRVAPYRSRAGACAQPWLGVLLSVIP